jgi:acyl-coenzyme A thioesterase PaaI-like protein
MEPELPSKGSRELAHFLAIPWAAEHLQGPNIRSVIPYTRRVKPGEELEPLISRVLNTSETISHFLLFYELPPNPADQLDELKGLLTLESGLDGFPGACHGGIVATILDEMLGLLIPINVRRGAFAKDARAMTAYLNTKFLAPVPTTATVLATARIVRVEGRKVFVEGSLWDHNSKELARGDALFVQLKSKI